MAKKTKIRYLKPGASWREANRAKQQAELPMNSPRLAKSKESRQTEEKAQARDQRTDSGQAHN